MILQESNRTRVEKIVHEGRACIRKTFKKLDEQSFADLITVMWHNSITPELIEINKEQCFFIRPYYPYNLQEYLDAKDGQANRRSLGAHLALGLFDLWNQGYIHRDVHANNIYINEAGTLFLCDWEHVCKREQGVPFWASPDLLGGSGAHAYWDKGQTADINTVLGLDSKFAINKTREALVHALERGGGAYWERLSKGQIYGTINVAGFRQGGRRDPVARLDQFCIDFTGKTVLDIGCNNGSISFEAFNRGASKVLGLELLLPRVNAARSIANFAGINNKVWFYQHNFDKIAVPNAPFDIVCAFAIDHQTQQPKEFYKKLYAVTGETLLFESSKQPEYRCWCMKQLEEAGFGYVKYIGESSASDKKHRSRMCYIARKK
jgi:2-polyprenyl-3-methyl-5-hydroxy-6-metoxy-1,4-benzoquinol methylase